MARKSWNLENKMNRGTHAMFNKLKISSRRITKSMVMTSLIELKMLKEDAGYPETSQKSRQLIESLHQQTN